VADRPVVGVTLRDIEGHTAPAVVAGRAPRNDHEVALGREVMRATGRRLGDSVVIADGQDPDARGHRYTLVGAALTPGVGDAQSLADGAFFTYRGLARAATITDNYFVVTLDRRAPVDATLRRLKRQNQNLQPIRPEVPAEIARVRQISALPFVLAGIIALVSVVAVGYTLVVAVRRRRRDLAVLKTMGFTRSQVRACVAWQASAQSGIGLVVGLVAGVMIGQRVWRTIANDLGVSTSVAWPLGALAVLLPVGLAFVNLVAAVPARTAARTPPARVLRSE